MTISDNYAPDKTLGNGVTTVFTGSWSPIASSYMKVYLEAVSDGTLTLQTQGVNYTLSFNDSGYTVTWIGAAPSSSYYVVRSREVELDQTNPYSTVKGFQGAVVEDSLDKLTAICQDLKDSTNRSLQFSVGSAVSGVVVPEPQALYLLGWNSAGTNLQNYQALSGTVLTTPFWDTVLATSNSAEALTALGAMSNANGNRGDITVSANGATWTINSSVLAKNIVSTTKTDTFTTTSSSYTAINGLSAAITPSKNSSKVRISCSITWTSAGTTPSSSAFRLMRNSTPIALGDSAGSRGRATAWMIQPDVNLGDGSYCTVNLEFVDSPSTTSSTTYSVECLVNGGTLYINRGFSDADSSTTYRSVSTITAEEILQ